MHKIAAVPSQPPPPATLHPSAIVSPRATIGHGTCVWHNVQIRENVTIGDHCIIGKDVYIDTGVTIGDHVKIQNSALLYQGLTVADGVFIGPRVCFTNDLYPRAINPDGTLKAAHDWTLVPTHVEYGASIGAGAIVVAGITIGCFAMIAAGAVVTHSVPPFGLVMGIPARLTGYVCRCGRPLQIDHVTQPTQANGSTRAPILSITGWCAFCQQSIEVGVPTP